MMTETAVKCYACDRKLTSLRHQVAFTVDGQMQYVGDECYKKVLDGGKDGYQPPLGGPRLYVNDILAKWAREAKGV